MTKLIGISGLARAGKDSFAAAFVKEGYQRLAFADALKVATAYIANEAIHLYFDEASKDQFSEALGMTRRKALQDMGNGVRETLGAETWIRRALREWVTLGLLPTVISDCRYPNEAQAIRNLGGTIVRVTRPGAGLAGAAGAHISEAGLPDHLVDIEVLNDGTMGDLCAEARKIVALLDRQP